MTPKASISKIHSIRGEFPFPILGLTQPSVDLARRLQSKGWNVVMTSEKPDKLARLLDMISTTIRLRHHYSVAHVDVFSGPAFSWAESIGNNFKISG